MKNILCNPQSFHFKYFMKSGRNSISSTSVKCFSNSLFGCQTLNEWDSDRKKDRSLLKASIRSLNTSVKKLEKLTDFNISQNKKDDISIIYNGSLTHRVKGVKVFSLVISFGGIIIQSMVLRDILSGKDLQLGVALLSSLGFFTFATPFLYHIMAKKYVTEIWYNPATKTYTATLLSFFLRRININFKIEDITVPTMPSIFTSVYIKGRPVFIVDDCFLEMEHYIKMMGYDKPLDLGLHKTADGLDKSQNKETSKVI